MYARDRGVLWEIGYKQWPPLNPGGGGGTHKSCEYKVGLSDETKNGGPQKRWQAKDPTQVDSSL
jgi:hypothetical protein